MPADEPAQPPMQLLFGQPLFRIRKLSDEVRPGENPSSSNVNELLL